MHLLESNIIGVSRFPSGLLKMMQIKGRCQELQRDHHVAPSAAG
jgi:hypothetical protein